MSCDPSCKSVGKRAIVVCCCCAPEPVPCVPPWLKKAFLSVITAIPMILAARWIITKGHVEYITERIQYLNSEKYVLECKIQSLIQDCCPSQKELSGSTARRKAALDQLRNWAWKSNCTYEKVAGLRKEKIELEHMLNRVCRERDSAKRDYAIVQNVMKRNYRHSCME